MKRTSLTLPARLLAVTALLSASSALAWKPITHNYLAEEALRDAQDGSVTIPVLVNGQPQNPPVFQTYQVDQALLSVLQSNVAQYRAGVMGPDAYPDIMTGQQVIHPHSSQDTPTTHKGSNEWLEHLWDSSRSDSPAVKAFVAGYLTHAAGDLFAHTFVNYYAGGSFAINPHTNASKHLVIEGYMGKRTPVLYKYNNPGSVITSGIFGQRSGTNLAPFYPSSDFSIAGVETFIYDKMVNVVPNSPLAGLYQGRLSAASVPFLYSKTKQGLQVHIDWYFREKDRLQNRLNDCGFLNLICKTKWSALLLTHTTVVWATKEYARAWQRDIDTGLRLWPSVSHALAMQLIYPSDDGDPKNAGITGDRLREADRIASDYFWNHMVSMTGSPDQGGPVARWALNFMSNLFPTWDWFAKMKERMVEKMIHDATGKTLDEWKDIASNPETKFDPVMQLAAAGATPISLQKMNSDVLMLPVMANGQPDPGYQDPSLRFSVDQLSPAYNTLIMSKLILISQSELVRFAQNLPYSSPAPTSSEIAAATQRNAILGFIDSLDGGNQRDESVIFRNCGAYNSVFKPQMGDERCTSAIPVGPTNPTTFEAYADTSREVFLSWSPVAGATRYTLERSTGTSTTYSAIATLTTTEHWDGNRQPRARYNYRLKAGNTGGLSSGVGATVIMPADPQTCKVVDPNAPVKPAADGSTAPSPDFIRPC